MWRKIVLYFRLTVLFHGFLPKVWIPYLSRPIVFLLVYIGARDFPFIAGLTPLKPLVLATIAVLCVRFILELILAKKYPLELDADLRKIVTKLRIIYWPAIILLIMYKNSETWSKLLVTYFAVSEAIIFLIGLTDKKLLQKNLRWTWMELPSPSIEYAAKVRVFAHLSFAAANVLAIRILDTNTWIVWMIIAPFVIMYFANTFTLLYDMRVSRGHEDSD